MTKSDKGAGFAEDGGGPRDHEGVSVWASWGSCGGGAVSRSNGKGGLSF